MQACAAAVRTTEERHELVSGPESLRALVAAAQRGDRRAFARLHALHSPAVHAVLLAHAGPAEAADLAQDVFLQALRKIHTVESPDAVGAWLCALARRRAADHHRRARRASEPPRDVAVRDPRKAEAAEVLDAIRALPAAYCETLLMRLVEGMTGPEIAAATGLTPGSVRVNLHRGMKLLRARLGEEDGR